jgi:hypothetical protein
MQAGDDDRPLQDLGEVVIHGISNDRARHRVISSERRKSLPNGERDSHSTGSSAQHLLTSEHQLVDVCVWMSTVYETLAPGARRELPITDREPFEIERAYKPKAIRERAAMYHDRGLDQADLAQTAIPRHRIGIGVEEYTLATDLDGG